MAMELDRPDGFNAKMDSLLSALGTASPAPNPLQSLQGPSAPPPTREMLWDKNAHRFTWEEATPEQAEATKQMLSQLDQNGRSDPEDEQIGMTGQGDLDIMEIVEDEVEVGDCPSSRLHTMGKLLSPPPLLERRTRIEPTAPPSAQQQHQGAGEEVAFAPPPPRRPKQPPRGRSPSGRRGSSDNNNYRPPGKYTTYDAEWGKEEGMGNSGNLAALNDTLRIIQERKAGKVDEKEEAEKAERERCLKEAEDAAREGRLQRKRELLQAALSCPPAKRQKRLSQAPLSFDDDEE